MNRGRPFPLGGTYQSEIGSFFNSDKVLLGPYGKAVCSTLYACAAATRSGDNEHHRIALDRAAGRTQTRVEPEGGRRSGTRKPLN